MKVMILAAGRGERMRPLTDSCPKPMLKVKGIPLIEHHINKLVAQGLCDIVINCAWLGEQIIDYFGDGKRWGARIQYSEERDGALETAGGIVNALPIIGEGEYLLVVNGDIYCDYDFSTLPKVDENIDIHLWLTDNPAHNCSGDFSLVNGEVLPLCQQGDALTYSGISLFRLDYFKQLKQQPKILPLGPLLREASAQRRVSGSKLAGQWTDVGTPERLAALNK
ncbi:N-acetylmuramate alpha-1-phosphate uridylyltransferase MurU [Thalassotalea fusca]